MIKCLRCGDNVQDDAQHVGGFCYPVPAFDASVLRAAWDQLYQID